MAAKPIIYLSLSLKDSAPVGKQWLRKARRRRCLPLVLLLLPLLLLQPPPPPPPLLLLQPLVILLLLFSLLPSSHQPCHVSSEALGQRVRMDKHSKRDTADTSRDDEGAAGIGSVAAEHFCLGARA